MAATDTTSKTISQSILTYILTKIKSFIPTNISELNNDKNYVTSDSVTTSLATKQDKLTFDTTPTTNSTNPVTSDGIKKAIDAKTVDLSGYQTKLTFDTTPTANSTNPVTSSGVKTALDGKLNTSGNAASASKLATARTISLAGNVTGSGSFDGSSNLTITTTCAQATKALNIPTSDIGGNIWIA